MAGAWLLAAAAVVACGSEPAPGTTPPPDSGSSNGGSNGAKDAAVASGPDSSAVDMAPLSSDTGGSQAAADAPSGAVDTQTGAPDADLGRDASGLPAVVKMMVMGSSNEISTCWRAFLWQKLRAAGVTGFDFVGGQTDGPDCGVPGYDRNNESRNGTIVSEITAAQYASRFRANPPDIVLVHFGGADILRGIEPAKVMPGYTLMVMQGRAVNPRIRFLVAEHTPMTPASCARCPTTVPQLNAAIVQWAKEISTAESPVASVDLFTGLDPATDTSDRVHLNNAGSQKVADIWVKALLPILKP
jgi:lysophospholipase L1-like esterase